MRVLSLHRYPVKSLLGEDAPYLDLDPRGVVGDRLWSVRTSNNKIGSGKNSNRFAAVPGLLALRAASTDGSVAVTFPDGTTLAVDAAELADRLTAHAGQPLTVKRETDVSHFDDGPVSLLGLASVEALAAARGESVAAGRFRPNITLDIDTAFAEDSWVGQRLQVGSAVLEVTMVSPRCVMIDMATADLPAQHGNLTAIGRLNDACLGVIAQVVRPGRITAGDAVTLVQT